MTNYREILRLKSQGYSERNIALAASCSRNTVSEVLQRAEDHDLTWPLSANVTNADLKKILYPPVTDSHKRLPDYNRVRKELMRNNTKTAVVHNKRWEDPQVNAPTMNWQSIMELQSFLRGYAIRKINQVLMPSELSLGIRASVKSLLRTVLP